MNKMTHFEKISIGLKILSLIGTVFALSFTAKQIIISRETNNRPLLRLVTCKKGIEANSFIDYIFNSSGGGDGYILSLANDGVGIARDIQIYSLNEGGRVEQLKTVSRNTNIVNDLEISAGNEEGINIRLSKAVMNNKKNYNFCITYKNIYKDIYHGVLSINDMENEPLAMFFNEGSNGYNTIINSLPTKICIGDILKMSKDKNNSNWIITKDWRT